MINEKPDNKKRIEHTANKPKTYWTLASNKQIIFGHPIWQMPFKHI